MRRAHLIANKNSGKGKGSTLAEDAKTICDELGFELVPYEINSPEDFEKQSLNAVDAAEKDGGVVIAAGGDGTIRGVAQAAANRKVRFAAVPCGTFNFFARNHNIPEDHLEAFRLALTGQAHPVQLGQLNDHIFLINASLGAYARAIKEREFATSKFGRNRLVVIISTFLSLLNWQRLLRINLIADNKKTSIYTPTVFVGNNSLQLKDLAMSVGDCVKQGMLAVVLVRPVTTIETLKIFARAIFKTLDQDQRLDCFCSEEMTIDMKKNITTVALDGEMLQTSSPLTIKALKGALNLVLPENMPAEAKA